MSKTSVGAGSSNAQFVQAAGLFAQSMQRNSKLNQMVGTMPKGEGSAAATLRKQTTNDMPIVRTGPVARQGRRGGVPLCAAVGAYPIMGARMAEGKGTGVSLDKARVRVNQARFPVDVGDTMTDLRSPVEFRKIGRPIAQGLMDRYQDQGSLMHLAARAASTTTSSGPSPPKIMRTLKPLRSIPCWLPPRTATTLPMAMRSRLRRQCR
jgi:hypothetical protein